MVSTRSSSQSTRPQNVKLTQADYDCAHTLMRLRTPNTRSSAASWTAENATTYAAWLARQMQSRSSSRSTAYNLRPLPARLRNDKEEDPTWAPWTRGH